jgi:2-methylcitrate dehydratase PrpD
VAASPGALLTALALGVDVAASLGLAATGPWRFFRPGIAGGFGAVAALGKLAGFDEGRLVDAFGIYYAQACGTMQAHAEGKPILPLQVGFNARNALAAVDLAAAGIPATRETFEGRFGYLPLFECDWDVEPVLAALGRRWRIAELSQKPFPCGRATHGAIDGVLQLEARHGFAAADVSRVTLYGSPLVHQLVARRLPAEPEPKEARLCLAYVAAVALCEGWVGLDDFAPARLRDPALHALAGRIAVERDDTLGPGVLLPQRLVVELRDGGTHEIVIATVLGHPDRPLDEARQRAKFESCWHAAGLPAARCAMAIDLIERIDELDDVAQLVAIAGQPAK